MRRSLYALAILIVLALAVAVSTLWVHQTAQELARGARLAYACALQGDYAASKAAYRAAYAQSRAKRRVLDLLVRRSLLDKITETLATLPGYAGPDNMEDLLVETERACEQLDQMALSCLTLL